MCTLAELYLKEGWCYFLSVWTEIKCNYSLLSGPCGWKFIRIYTLFSVRTDGNLQLNLAIFLMDTFCTSTEIAPFLSFVTAQNLFKISSCRMVLIPVLVRSRPIGNMKSSVSFLPQTAEFMIPPGHFLSATAFPSGQAVS